MEYVKQQIEGSEDFNVIRIAAEEKQHYLENGYVEATKEEYEANGGEKVEESNEELAEVPAEEASIEEISEEVNEEVAQ